MSKDKKQIESEFITKIEFIKNHFNSPISVMMDLKNLVGNITSFNQTKDHCKDEIQLHIKLLSEILKQLSESIDEKCRPNDKLCVFLIDYAFLLLVKAEQFNFNMTSLYQTQLHTLEELLSDNDKLMRTSLFHGFETSWLVGINSPKNILKEYKELKSKGYLDPYSSLLKL